jgi:hypothetical protein
VTSSVSVAAAVAPALVATSTDLIFLWRDRHNLTAPFGSPAVWVVMSFEYFEPICLVSFNMNVLNT